MSVTVLNTTASLSGKTLAKLEDSQTVTGLKTFDLGAAAPFAVVSGAAKVANLDADLLDGSSKAFYTDVSNADAGTLAIARGGTNSTATATAGGVGYGTGTAHAYTAAGTAGQLVLSGGAGAPTFKNDPLVLLRSLSGTHVDAAAANVDTVAITGLTVEDKLRVEVVLESVTQATAASMLYNATDAVQLAYLHANGAIAAGAGGREDVHISVRQNSTVNTCSYNSGGTFVNGNLFISGAFTVTTAWTGAWTLALRLGGVTAGGTCRWRWAVYKVAGQ